MILGYSKWWKFDEALALLPSMHRSDVKFNESTFSTALSLCGRLQSLSLGKQIHCVVIKSGFENFELVGSSFLYFHANCFEMDEANRVFNELHDKTELWWNLMIAGYVESGLMREALDMLMKMPKRDGLVAAIADAKRIYDGATNPSLNASNSLIRGFISTGKIEDAELIFNRLVEANLVYSNMMIKEGGEIDKALKLFEETRGERNSVTWNSMMSGYIQNEQYKEALILMDSYGYAHHGLGSQAISLFEHMLENSVVPNGATFVGILSACAHAGLVFCKKLRSSLKRCQLKLMRLFGEFYSIPVGTAWTWKSVEGSTKAVQDHGRPHAAHYDSSIKVFSFADSSSLLKGGIGVVIRDIEGFVVGEAAIPLSNILDANLADALAAREGSLQDDEGRVFKHGIRSGEMKWSKKTLRECGPTCWKERK
ncbi:hypothetical protein V6N11_041129 [Hibiscus sabdariffa]|uniref:Pentatricopeptide repeat-containing protein n=1 Tax=Hibiscus sabdariffa TaxID=183260 RepID=A0ABR2RJJ8_9ROSI